MAKHGALLIVGAVALALASGGGTVLADSPAPPFSYKVVTSDGKFIFVMIAPLTVDQEALNWNEATAAEIREIRRAYSQSGLYRNDGSTEPLWTVNWYAHSVEVASDGVHLIRHGPWASSIDQEAISFFANGTLLRTYQIRELVDNPVLLERSVSHFLWQNKSQLDDARLEYMLTTKDGNRFVFDIRTGEIVSKSQPGRILFWAIAAGISLLLLGFLFRLLRRGLFHRQSEEA